jgi:alkanesulfonate monooxygenase SsuD/methylene tetrahydromethanopterin reductase-like flavin-dependent oxidoreductase (luciferase family)
VGQVGAPLLSVRRSIFGTYRDGLVSGGHDPARAKLSGPVNVFLTDDPDRVREQVVRAYDYIWDSYAAHADGAGEVRAGNHSQRAIELGLEGGLRGLLIATPEHAAQELTRYFDGIPVDTVFAWGRLPGVDDATMRRHLELWCRELPAVLSAGATTLDTEKERLR